MTQLRLHFHVDSDQADAAQDEGHDRCGQSGARRKANAGDIAPGADRAGQPGEYVAAQVVYGSAPEAASEGPGHEFQIPAVDDLARAQTLQKSGLTGFAGQCSHFVAASGQKVDGDGADAAGRSGHQHGPQFGPLTIVFEAVHRERGGEASCPDRHGAPRIDPFGKAHHAIALDSGKPCVTAVAALSEAAAKCDDLVARATTPVGAFHHLAGEIDAAHQGKVPHDGRRPRCGKRVLVVDAAVFDPDQYVSGREVIEGEFLQFAPYDAVVSVYAQCPESF